MSLNAMVIGGVSVLIGADASALVKGADTAEARMKALEKTTSNIVSRLKNAFLALAGPTAIGALIHSSLELIDTQSKLGRQVDGSLESIQALARVADLAGVSQDQLAMALGRLNRKLGEAQRDALSPAADAFRKLGLNVKDLVKLDADDRIGVIADRLKTLGYNASQTADWLGQIGIRGGKIAAIFENGSAPIKEASQELAKFGVTMSTIDGEQIEIANDAMTIFGVAVRGVGNQLALTASVIMPKVAKAFKDWGEDGEGVGKLWAKVIDDIVVGFGVIPHMIYNVRLAWDAFMDFVMGTLNIFAEGWNSTLGKFGMPLDHLKNDYGKLKDTLEAPLNAEEFRKWWAEQRTEAAKTAQAAKDARDALKGKDNADTSDISSKERKALQEKLIALKQAIANEDEVLRLNRDKQLKELAEFEQKKIIVGADAAKVRADIMSKFDDDMKKLKRAQFEDELMTENQRLDADHALKLKKLKEFEDAKTYTTDEAARIRQGLEEKYQLKSLETMSKQWSACASIVDTAMSAISSIMEDESEKGFTIMKAVAYATALVKGFEATVSAYAAGAATGIPGMGPIMAAVAAAGTAAIIAKMAGVGPKSKGTVTAGSSGGGGGGGGGGGQQASSAPAQPTHSMYVQGLNPREWMRGDNVKAFAEELLQYQKNGGEVFFER